MKITAILVAASFLVGSTAGAFAQGQTPVPTPGNQGGSMQQQEMKRNNPDSMGKKGMKKKKMSKKKTRSM